MEFLQILTNWYSLRPEILWSIFVPTLISILFLSYWSYQSSWEEKRMGLWLMIICAAMGYEFSFWSRTEESLSLFVVQMPFILISSLMFLKINIKISLAYPLTFISDLLVDVIQSYFFHPALEEYGNKFYLGIGGAGYQDALFIYPIFSILIIFYISFREKNSFKLLQSA